MRDQGAPPGEWKSMRTRFVVLLFPALLCAACQKQPSASADAAPAAMKQAPAPGDPEYVAEDPRLTRLIGTPGPAIALQAIDGSLIDLADTYGKKPVYLKLWASYCIPCRAQMPKFEKIYESVGDRIQVIAVNAGVGDDAAKVAAFAAKTGIRMPIAIDDGSLSAWLGMQETPLHLIVGRDGRIVFAGHQDGAELDAALERTLGSPAPSEPVHTVAVNRVAAIRVGDSVPAMALTGPDGVKVPLRGGAGGHARALLFTSTWCESYLQQVEPQTAERCRRVRDDVARIARSGKEVQWLGVVSHLWTSPQSLADYRAQTGQTLPYVVDTDGTAFQVFGIRRFPAVALIDAEGRLRRIVGPDDGDLAEAVESLTERG
jgi:thiol-disulfide isomerase/thioredoxin